MVQNMTSRSEKKQLIEAFNILDLNGDGVLTKNELADGATLALGGEVQELVQEIFIKLDKNASGQIDFTGINHLYFYTIIPLLEFLAGSIDKTIILS